MKIGDIVRVIPASFNPLVSVQNIKSGDIGIVVGCPVGYGDVVDIVINEKKIRYWIGMLEVINERSDNF